MPNKIAMSLNKLLIKHNLTKEDFELIKKSEKRFNSDYNKLYEFVKLKFGESVSSDLYYFLVEVRNEEKTEEEISRTESLNREEVGKKRKITVDIAIKLCVIILLVISFSRLPYGYYTLLRLTVTGSAIYFAYKYYEEKKIIWVWIFGIIAVLFNPLVPIYLQRGTWMVIDILTSIIYLISIFLRADNVSNR